MSVAGRQVREPALFERRAVQRDRARDDEDEPLGVAGVAFAAAFRAERDQVLREARAERRRDEHVDGGSHSSPGSVLAT